MHTLESDGFTLVRNALTPTRLAQVMGEAASLNGVGPGTRCLLSCPWVRELAAEVRTQPKVSRFIPQFYRAIQCTYFEKSAQNNWLVPVHQDLSVPVSHRLPLPGWGPWSVKEGSTFVQPPLSVLQSLVAVRLHLDPCGPTDGPLYVVPGSHLQGVVASENARLLRQHEVVCLASGGDALVFRPLLLHRSSKGSGTSRRRVLHLLFAPPEPVAGLEWRSAA